MKDEKPDVPGSDGPEGYRRSYQNDPRYRDFYERRKKNQEQQSKSIYDEEVEAVSLEELSKKGYEGVIKETAPSRPAPAVPNPVNPPSSRGPMYANSPVPQRAPAPGARTAAGEATEELISGMIFHFDDDSIGIYKDAVSGKDYALFYFLEPDMTVSAQGIFMEQYERQRIGLLKEPYLEKLWAEKRWDRDIIVFHLDRAEFVSYLRNISYRTPHVSHQVRKPAGEEERRRAYQEHRQSTRTPSTQRDPLERGRVVRLNVGGRIWEAVYWTRDEIGPIVAHNTNREWALMHFDINRFKDSIEYGNVLSLSELEEIEQSLAPQG